MDIPYNLNVMRDIRAGITAYSFMHQILKLESSFFVDAHKSSESIETHSDDISLVYLLTILI